jgi:hypothetical protein
MRLVMSKDKDYQASKAGPVVVAVKKPKAAAEAKAETKTMQGAA